MFKSPVQAAIITVLAGAVFIVAWLWWLAQPAASQPRDVPFVVEEGMGVRDIAAALERANVIRSPWYFVWQVKSSGVGARLQAGEYVLSPSQAVEDIVRALANGGATGRERTITIIEGWRVDDIAAYLEEEGFGPADEFTHLASTWCDQPARCEEYDFLRDLPEGAGLEGFLFPDTYRVYRDARLEDIINVMLANFERKFTPELRDQLADRGLDLYEAVTLASIIEKEVRTPADMALVGGVFRNRLDIGMALQSDATLTYYFDNETVAHTGADLQVDTPYNTYRYRGLPPTPIANPGLNALRAAVYPAETDYLYFLSDTETGTTYFSHTLEEHNANKRRYVK